MLKNFRRGPINKESSSGYTFLPKPQWHPRLIIESPGNIQQVLMFSFHHRILLRSFYTIQLMENALFIHKLS